MKRILSLIIALAMILTVAGVAVYADDSEVNVRYDANTKQVTVSGTFPENHGRVAVLLSKYNEETLNSYDDLTESNVGANLIYMTTWDGETDLVITLPDTIEVGYYVAFCSAMGSGSIAPAIFYITDIDEQNTAINAFKTATAETVGTAIATYAVEKPVVNLNLNSEIYTANTADVHKIFVNCMAEEVAENTDLTLSSISVCFERALAIVDFNIAADKGATLGNYKTLLGISETEDSTTYFAAAADLILLQSEAIESKILSQSALNKAFDKGVAICVVNSSTRETVRGNLKAYEGIIGIDVDAGYQSAVETKLNAAMAFSTFTKTEDIKSAFETAVAQNLKPTNQGGSSVGGGSSIGGGSFGGGSSGGGITGGGGQTTVARPPVSSDDKTPMEAEGVFSDIASYTWAKDAISYLNKKGVLQGVGDGKFEPARSIKREEIAKIMVEAFDITAKEGEKEFKDVSEGAWHYKYVNIAYQNGIINGVSKDSFGTGSNVTRQDAAVMIYRYLKSTGYKFETDGEEFSDIDVCADYAREAVQALKNSGLIAGNGDNTFNPKDSLTRAQAAVMIYNIISEMEAK